MEYILPKALGSIDEMTLNSKRNSFRCPERAKDRVLIKLILFRCNSNWYRLVYDEICSGIRVNSLSFNLKSSNDAFDDSVNIFKILPAETLSN